MWFVVVLVGSSLLVARHSTPVEGVWAGCLFFVLYRTQKLSLERRFMADEGTESKGLQTAWEQERQCLEIPFKGALISSAMHAVGLWLSAGIALSMAGFGYAISLFLLSNPFQMARLPIVLMPFLGELGILVCRNPKALLLPMHFLLVAGLFLIPGVLMIGHRLSREPRDTHRILTAQAAYLYLCVWVSFGLIFSGQTIARWDAEKDRAPERGRGTHGMIYL
jgi:hypothetical protein